MKLRTMTAGLAILLMTGCAGSVKTVKSPSYDPAAVKRVAVSALNGPNQSLSTSIADSFVPDLMDMGFTVVERTQLERVLKEQSLQLTGAVDPATLKEVGRIAGVDALLVGDYSVHGEKTVSREINVRRRPMARRRPGMRQRPGPMGRIRVAEDTIFDSLSLRLVSVTTGEVLLSASRREQFDASRLDSVLEEIAVAMKKGLK
jgi:curli biogenesis system outer membrane secretion channel CsgG